MSIFRTISEKINNTYSKALSLGIKIMYRHQYNALLKNHSKDEPISPMDSIEIKEKEWIKLWNKLSKHPHVNSFRLFSKYIGPDINIVPEDICACVIQPILNPIETRPFYQDKNMFDLIIGKDKMPRTLLRCVNGCLMNRDYKYIIQENRSSNKYVISEANLKNFLDGYNTIFIKPSVDSSSGKGVVGFNLDKDGVYREIGGDNIFNSKYINEYSKIHPDFILQEGLIQHPYLSQFNKTSINTIRIATYRSVKDNKVHIVGVIMRIGKKGSCVDNSHAGGVAIGITKDGTLCKFAIDSEGNRYDCFNDINFRDGTFKIPEIDRILNFAKEIGKNIYHHRLVAQDICLDYNGNPKLIEYNIGAYGLWVFQFTNSPALGEFAPEIIEYCSRHISNINKIHVEAF